MKTCIGEDCAWSCTYYSLRNKKNESAPNKNKERINVPVLAPANRAVECAFATFAHLYFGHRLAGNGVKEIGAVDTVAVRGAVNSVCMWR